MIKGKDKKKRKRKRGSIMFNDTTKKAILNHREVITNNLGTMTVAAVGAGIAALVKIVFNQHDRNLTRVIYYDEDSKIAVTEDLSWENEVRDMIHGKDYKKEKKDVKKNLFNK